METIKSIDDEEMNRILKYLEYFSPEDLGYWHSELIESNNSDTMLFSIIDDELKKRNGSKSNNDEINEKLYYFLDTLMDTYDAKDVENCMLSLFDTWNLYCIKRTSHVKSDGNILLRNDLFEEIKDKLISYLQVLENKYGNDLIKDSIRGIYDKYNLYRLNKNCGKEK